MFGRHNDKSLKEALGEYINAHGYRDHLYELKVKDFWSEKMGSSIVKYTVSLKLRRNKLTIKVNSASLKNDLTFLREKIIQRVNDHLGEPYVKEVIIK